MNRRRFLVALGAGAAAAGCARRSALGARRRSERPIAPGVQLYTVRADMRRDVERTLARVASLGYCDVEFHDYFGRTPAEVRAALDAAGLASPSTHAPLEALAADRREHTFDAAATVGHRWVVVPWLASAQRRTVDDWKRVAARLNEAGAAARAHGLRVGYHNHDFELAPLEGRVPLDVLVTETDAALVDLQLDVFWAVKGGASPSDLLRRYGKRVTSLHLKDSAGPPAHRQVDVGAGTIDWAAVLAAGADVRHAYVEHDDPADAWASLAASRAGVRRVGIE